MHLSSGTVFIYLDIQAIILGSSTFSILVIVATSGMNVIIIVMKIHLLRNVSMAMIIVMKSNIHIILLHSDHCYKSVCWTMVIDMFVVLNNDHCYLNVNIVSYASGQCM